LRCLDQSYWIENSWLRNRKRKLNAVFIRDFPGAQIKNTISESKLSENCSNSGMIYGASEANMSKYKNI
jgi:hypothetical protein